MSLYVRLQCSFYTHRKTAKLRARLGHDAFWIPPRIWAYAAEHQPDGDFSKYDAGELAMLIGYNKDACSMLEALQAAEFFDGMKIHDWSEHNGYHDTFAARAKKAAAARWEKERSKEKGYKKGKERSKHEPSIAQAMLTDATSIPTLLKGQEGFAEMLSNYHLYRKEIKLPLTPTAEKMLLKELCEHPERATKALESAMNARWRGFNWEWLDNRLSQNKTNSRGTSERGVTSLNGKQMM